MNANGILLSGALHAFRVGLRNSEWPGIPASQFPCRLQSGECTPDGSGYRIALAANGENHYLTAPLLSSPLPFIMTGQTDCRGYPLGRVGRVLLAAWSLCLLGGFAVALFIVPDPRGFGTHEQLGLPPCRFKTTFDVPCPSCGMTTSFSNFTRGRFMTSAQANPAGFLLAAVCAVGIPWCWLSVWTGRFWRMSAPDAWLMGILFALCSVSILQWIVRLVLSN